MRKVCVSFVSALVVFQSRGGNPEIGDVFASNRLLQQLFEDEEKKPLLYKEENREIEVEVEEESEEHKEFEEILEHGDDSKEKYNITKEELDHELEVLKHYAIVANRILLTNQVKGNLVGKEILLPEGIATDNKREDLEVGTILSRLAIYSTRLAFAKNTDEVKVIHLNGASLKNQSYRFHDDGSVLIVNIDISGINECVMQAMNHPVAAHVVYHFYDYARNEPFNGRLVTSGVIFGTVLAPKASIIVGHGGVVGSVIVDELLKNDGVIYHV